MRSDRRYFGLSRKAQGLLERETDLDIIMVTQVGRS